ncbi:MAG TPA: azurin [Lacunisphaera sp.]|nr:azurin [Lacunisphaera sp.]
MKTNPSILCLAIPALAALILSGCGKSETPAATATASAPSPAASSQEVAQAREIEITANDAMKFNVAEIRAKPGERLSVTLTNLGTMPKFSMGHNWVLLAAGVKVEAFANDASTAVKTDYVPAAYKDRVLAATKLLGPKQSDTVVFQAPKEPGRYPFVCSFPGHFQVGMKGELIVE